MRESWPPARPCEHGNVSLIGGSKRHWSKYNVVQILQICVVLLDFKSVCVIGEHVFPFEYVLKDYFLILWRDFSDVQSITRARSEAVLRSKVQ